ARRWATRPQGSSRVPRCAVEGGSARLVACRIGEARRAARLFTRNRAHRHVGWPPKCRLVNHDERRPYRQASRDPVTDSGPILRHRSGPSSPLSGPIAGFLARVADARRTPTPIRPFHRRGPTGLHRTQFRNPNRKSRKREKGKKIGRARRGWHSKSYAQFVSFVWFSWH